MAHEPRSFLCAPGLRIENQERMTQLQFTQLNQALVKIEGMMERLEKRLWLTVYGVVAVILAQAVQSILRHLP
ncbi:hypothetical protein FHG66_00475 [Rubellimicrobium rubrum]|uniref:Uncharacterized protein n=1 Tax=Rubellimicrobium rubrum TaxID=2585369 RepID=A0A5C4N3D4_9RHOB|nr:hypothetical protein [Rubellimicrobium rubrum]TNC52806.1 hypothetical protein FHG66_00475 [Rubellimicrobium rubrum]